MAISVAQLQTWRDEAIAAKQTLLIGGGIRRVQGPSGEVEFTAADLSKLDVWIAQLGSWIASGGMPATGGGATYYPIRFTF